MKRSLLALTGLLALTATSALAAKKKTSPEATPKPAVTAPAPTASGIVVKPLRPGEYTTYFCTIWHEVSFDTAAAPKLAPVGYVPIPHMGNISLFRETGVPVPRPVDLWDDEHDDHGHDHSLVKAPDTASAAPADTIGYALQWLDLKGGQVKYEHLTIREDFKGLIKPFFAGMGGNLYIGTCDQDLGE